MEYLRLCAIIFSFVSQLISGADKFIVTTDDLENNITSDDLKEFFDLLRSNSSASREQLSAYKEEVETTFQLLNVADCFGLGPALRKFDLTFDVRPASSEEIDTHYYFSSRKIPKRVQVFPGEQFGLEWVDYDPNRKTVLIVHGFMSDGNASWVLDMTDAFLKWGDVNVIAVDWSRGGNTWNYLKAVANTRRVGSDITRFLRELTNATGARVDEFHFVGHSMGAHICAYASRLLGGVARITGLDPAQPCFNTADDYDKLDVTDADFVDVIHTNGRVIEKLGFGVPEPTGHADFYPNGGMKQPGCSSVKSLRSFLPALFRSFQESVCSHLRAHELFTESLISAANNCSFSARRWDLTYNGINTTLGIPCLRRGSCSEMGINAVGDNASGRAAGVYFVVTTQQTPYCPRDIAPQKLEKTLLQDLLDGFNLSKTFRKERKSLETSTMGTEETSDVEDSASATDKPKCWFGKWFCKKSS